MEVVGGVKVAHRTLCTAVLVVLPVLLAVPARADAAGHRARLSADLADHLAAGSPAIDVIVHGTRAEVDALARKYNVRVRRYLRSGAVLRVTAGQLAALQEDESQEHLSADVPIRSVADVTAQSIGADQVWAGSEQLPPLTGAGVVVAVIDSGIDPKHSALRNRVVHSVDFTGGDGVDRFGHGTHVAALIAGRPGRTVETADYRGIASGARIVNLRVLGADGSGMSSDVIEAIDWAVDHRKQFDIKVINVSLGAPVTQPYRDDPMCEAVERAVAAGIVVVVAAGNYGADAEGRTVYGSIATPGNDPSAITVGAVDTHGTPQRSDDTVARFSSRGPTRFDLVLKPDIVAPGSRIVSAEAQESYLAKTYPQRHVAGERADAYLQLSGTSMAAGVVSGTVALLLEKRPRLNPFATGALLQTTSSSLSLEGFVSSGAGELNAIAAAAALNGKSRNSVSGTVIFGEVVEPAGFVFLQLDSGRLVGSPGSISITHLRLISILRAFNSDTIVSGTDYGTFVWGTGNDTIVWGTRRDTNVWGPGDDTIVWGTHDTIVWGTGDDTIVWGTTTDTIVWGTEQGVNTAATMALQTIE